MDVNERIFALYKQRQQMIEYLEMKTREEDWHGVQDAASDLRDIDSEARGLKYLHAERKPVQ